MQVYFCVLTMTNCHIDFIQRLEEVAHSLLKVGTYDAETMSCRGLQRYVQEILPEGIVLL